MTFTRETWTIESLRETVVKWAHMVIVGEKQELIACVFATNGTDVFMVPPEKLVDTDEGKERFVRSMRELFKENNITACCFATEAWGVKRALIDPAERPSNAADRQELFTITLETPTTVAAESWLIEPGREALTYLGKSDYVETRWMFLASEKRGLRA